MNDFFNYVLFFFATPPKEVQQRIDALYDNICSGCPKREACHDCGRKIKPVGVYDTDNLQDINQLVEYLNTEGNSTFALLMDTKKEVLYLYIGDFDSNDLKYMIYYINMMFDKSYEVKNVVDLTDTLKLKAAPGVN